jgi:hypothetical protein
MVKKVGVKLMGLFVLAFFSLNLYLYLNRDNEGSSLSGLATAELPLGLNMSLIAFILQWVILLLVVIFAYTKFLKHRREEDEKIQGFVIPPLDSRSETSLDVFYQLLKEKKSLSIRSISILFKIKKEVALEWAKILEDQDLATIEYPAFSEPEVKFKEQKDYSLEQEEMETEKPKEQKQENKNQKQDNKESAKPSEKKENANKPEDKKQK